MYLPLIHANVPRSGDHIHEVVPKRLPCESFVIQSDGHGINMLPDHPVQLPHSPMDSIQQPKNSNSNSNRNRNIGQRDVRFLFRIAAILDGLACVPGILCIYIGFSLAFFWSVGLCAF